MGVKQCELCDLPARMHCESDQASLCWDCDAKVHGANFLVARHSRCLLCRSCQSPTPWKAEGVRLGATFSVCERCAGGGGVATEGEEDGDRGGGGRGPAGSCGGEGKGVRGMDEVEDEVNLEEDEDEEAEEDLEEEEEDDDDDGENQVVPWSLTPLPPAASSSSGEESYRTDNGGGFLKRMRENADLAVSQKDFACSSPSPSYPASNSSSSLAPAPAAEDEATSFASAFRPSKDRRRTSLRPAAGSAVLGLRLMSRARSIQPES